MGHDQRLPPASKSSKIQNHIIFWLQSVNLALLHQAQSIKMCWDLTKKDVKKLVLNINIFVKVSWKYPFDLSSWQDYSSIKQQDPVLPCKGSKA